MLGGVQCLGIYTSFWWANFQRGCLRKPLIVRRKSIKRGDKVLGSPHPHPNHVKGVFSALHFFCIENRAFLGEIRHGEIAENTSVIKDYGDSFR
jgi:hypothetical protein